MLSNATQSVCVCVNECVCVYVCGIDAISSVVCLSQDIEPNRISITFDPIFTTKSNKSKLTEYFDIEHLTESLQFADVLIPHLNACPVSMTNQINFRSTKKKQITSLFQLLLLITIIVFELCIYFAFVAKIYVYFINVFIFFSFNDYRIYRMNKTAKNCTFLILQIC